MKELDLFLGTLSGQIAGLRAGLYAVIDHPNDPSTAAARLNQLSETPIAKLLPSEVSEEFLMSFQRELNQVKDDISSLLLKRPPAPDIGLP